jgi:hypothetical protein
VIRARAVAFAAFLVRDEYDRKILALARELPDDAKVSLIAFIESMQKRHSG